MDFSLELINQNLIKGVGQEALPLWESLEGPINALGGYLHSPEPMSDLLYYGVLTALLAMVYGMRMMRAYKSPNLRFLEPIAAIFLLFSAHVRGVLSGREQTEGRG